MTSPVKIFPFNADKSYILSDGAKLADGSGTLGSLIAKTKENIVCAYSDKRTLPFIVTAGIGKGNVFADKGSTRFFFVLEAKENARFGCGLTTEAIKALSAGEKLPQNPYSEIKVKNGDFITVPKNTPYFASEGVSFIEVYSTSCNLHIIENTDALAEFSFAKSVPLLKKPAFHNERDGFSVRLMCTCESFTAAQINIVGEYKNSVRDSSFMFLFCLDGAAELAYSGEKRDIKAGDCLFFPAGMGDFSIKGGIETVTFTK